MKQLKVDRTRWLVSAIFLIFLALAWVSSTFFVTSVAATDVGKYRESFGNAQAELESLNESFASLERANVSAVDAIREKVNSLKSSLNVSDIDVVKEEIAIESNVTEALRGEVSKLNIGNRGVFWGVFATLGLLGGFWSAFLLYTLLSAIVKR